MSDNQVSKQRIDMIQAEVALCVVRDRLKKALTGEETEKMLRVVREDIKDFDQLDDDLYRSAWIEIKKLKKEPLTPEEAKYAKTSVKA